MSRMLTPSRVEAAFWMLLCGSLVGGIGTETDWGRRWQWPLPEVKTPPVDFRAPSLAEPFQLASPDAFLETTLRPIFVVTRRPAPVPPDPEPPKPSMKKDQFVLTGTTLVAEGRFAYLFEKATNKAHVLREGQEVNGVRLRTVANDRVVLSQYDDEETLVLKPVKPPALPMAPAAAAEGQEPTAAQYVPPRPRSRPSAPGGMRPAPGNNSTSPPQ